MAREFTLKDKHGAVQALWTSVNEGGAALERVPHIVRTIIETEAWRERQDGDKVYRHKSFRAFIETPPRDGCGWPIDKVEKLLSSDPDTLTMWRKAVTPLKHKRRDNDIVIISGSEQGNARAYTLDRLSRERPDLHRRVCAGELSANAAAIEAGFRVARKCFRTDDVDKAVAVLLSAFSRRDIEEALSRAQAE